MEGNFLNLERKTQFFEQQQQHNVMKIFVGLSICQMRRLQSLSSSSNQHWTCGKLMVFFCLQNSTRFTSEWDSIPDWTDYRVCCKQQRVKRTKCASFIFNGLWIFNCQGHAAKRIQQWKSINCFLNGNLDEAFSLTKNTINYPELNLSSTLPGRKSGNSWQNWVCVRESFYACVHMCILNFPWWAAVRFALLTILFGRLCVQCMTWFQQDLCVQYVFMQL